jgi:hypothetical protein
MTSNVRPVSGWNGWVTRKTRCGAAPSTAFDGFRQAQGRGERPDRPAVGLGRAPASDLLRARGSQCRDPRQGRRDQPATDEGPRRESAHALRTDRSACPQGAAAHAVRAGDVAAVPGEHLLWRSSLCGRWCRSPRRGRHRREADGHISAILQRTQERHQPVVFAPPLRWRTLRDLAQRQRLRFHF